MKIINLKCGNIYLLKGVGSYNNLIHENVGGQAIDIIYLR
jgi:hypothetical protein